MPKRLLSLGLAACLALVPLSRASACCDDFLGCLGAVLSLGASCKAEQIAQAIDGVKKLIAAVKQARAGFATASDKMVDDTKDQIKSAGDGLKHGAQQAVDDIKKAVGDTQVVAQRQEMKLAPAAMAGGSAVAGPGAMALAPAGSATSAGAGASALGGGAAAPGGSNASVRFDPPADPRRVAADLKRALEWVQAVQLDAETKKAPAVRTHADAAQKEVQDHEPPAREIVNTNLQRPLDNIEGQLEHILAQIFNPFDFSSVTKYVDDQVKLIQGRAPNTFDEMSDRLVHNAQDRMDSGQKELDAAKQGANDAQKVADMSKKLHESGKQSDMMKLENLIGAPPNSAAMLQPAVVSVGGGRATSSISSVALQKVHGTARASSAHSKTLSAGLATKWNATRPLLTIAPVAVTPAMRKRVDDDFARMFAGKAAPDVRNTQAQLLAQAKVRFANDPKTLAAVETYLQQKTAPLIQSASAPIRR